jgi:hypothetical protein
MFNHSGLQWSKMSALSDGRPFLEDRFSRKQYAAISRGNIMDPVSFVASLLAMCRIGELSDFRNKTRPTQEMT